MIRVVTTKRLRRLEAEARRMADFEDKQARAHEALESTDRRQRRRAHRDLWSKLPGD